MKKKVTKKASTNTTARKKVTKPAVRSSSRHRYKNSSETIMLLPVNFRRVVVWGFVSCLVLALILTLNGQQLSPAVAGASIYRGIVARYDAQVELPEIEGAVEYNIYYKKSEDSEYTHAARNISTSVKSYLISSLRNDEDYVYRIAAIDDSGAEFWWSPMYPLSNIQ